MFELCCRKNLSLKALAEELTVIEIDKSDSLRRGDWEADPLPHRMVHDLFIAV